MGTIDKIGHIHIINCHKPRITQYIFLIDGEPYGQSCPRFNHKTDTTCNTDKSREYRELVRLKALKKIKEPLKGAVEVEIWAVFAPPKSWNKAKTAQAYKQRIFPLKKPDANDIAKAILDGLNGIAFADDAQVARLAVNKMYGEEPHVLVEIRGEKCGYEPEKQNCGVAAKDRA